MPQPKKAARFGGSPAHHQMIVANLATELFRHGRIRTTKAKAKTVQPVAERMITFAKRGDVHARRQVLKVIRDKDVVAKLFADIAPAVADRNGGYTRVLKLGPRKGDAAEMALIELVEGVGSHGEGALEEVPRRRWSLRRRRGGSMSRSARQREEDRQAALDRGEPEEAITLDEGTDEAAEAVPAGTMEQRERPQAPAADTAAAPDDDGPQVTPEQVAARLSEADEDTDDDDAAATEPADVDADDAPDADAGESRG